MRVAFCCDLDELDQWNRRLIDELRTRMDVSVVHSVADLRGPTLERFDIGVLRARDPKAQSPAWFAALLLESTGVGLLDSLRARETSRHKAVTHALFARAGIDQPDWRLVEDADDCKIEWTGRIIVKPACGGRGEGIRIYGSRDEAMADVGAWPIPVVIQPLVENAESWRVIQGRSLGAISVYEKQPAEGEVIASVARGSRRRHRHAPGRICDMAERMLRAVGGRFMGADILRTNAGLLALELNANLGFDLDDARVPAAFVSEVEAAAAENAR